MKKRTEVAWPRREPRRPGEPRAAFERRLQAELDEFARTLFAASDEFLASYDGDPDDLDVCGGITAPDDPDVTDVDARDPTAFGPN